MDDSASSDETSIDVEGVYGCDGQRTSTVDRRPSTRSVVVGDAVAGRLRKYERGVRGCPINLLKPFDEFRGR
jgi:hypothetical protein